VSGTDRDVVAALRSELAAIEPARACDLEAERAGLMGGSGNHRDPVLARLAVRLERRGTASARMAARSVAQGAGAGAGAHEPASFVALGPPFDWKKSSEHCRMAYLRGRFLARGSLSLAGGRTHLEFVLGETEARALASQLSDVGLPAPWRTRRGRGVVTWKSAETVGLFLRRIGAGGALLELEARQVSRTLRGELNRVLNAESANLQRSVAAAGRQLAAIDVLDADGRLTAQPYAVRAAAQARRETPEATLSDLAERLGRHRSAVQRALERIERLAVLGEAVGPPLA
jgi:hypothetical protein